MKLTAHGKRMIVESMYSKGHSFLGAAALLRKNAGHEYVTLHLLCQGIEIVLKSFLLAIDYDKFMPKLRTKFHHNLVDTTNAVITEFNLRPLKPSLKEELKCLSALYSKHRLRYASSYDIMVDPHSIASGLVFRRIVAAMRLARRKGLFIGVVI